MKLRFLVNHKWRRIPLKAREKDGPRHRCEKCGAGLYSSGGPCVYPYEPFKTYWWAPGETKPKIVKQRPQCEGFPEGLSP